jgi:hypothetical protein
MTLSDAYAYIVFVFVLFQFRQKIYEIVNNEIDLFYHEYRIAFELLFGF